MQTSLLIHKATWYKVTASDPVFGEEKSKAKRLANVRFSETTRRTGFDSVGAEDADSITLFYFCGLSTVNEERIDVPDFRVGERIDGFVIKGIRRVSDSKGLHHLEVTLE